MRITAALILCLLLGAGAAEKHEFYATVTELHLKEDTLQVAIRIFTDDFEHTLKEESGEKVFLDASSDHDRVFEHIRSYMESHFKAAVDSTGHELRWIGYEYVDDVTWVYAESIVPAGAALLLIENTLLLKHFPAQQNMVNLRTANGYESQLCTKDQSQARFMLKR